MCLDCAGPVTGAHFNPLITMGTFCARLTSLPRMILYIIGQSIGAILGAFLVRASLGVGKQGVRVVPGCFVDSSLVSPAEAWVTESMMCFIQLFLAFGLVSTPFSRRDLMSE
jgi:glycerol uptake facilitator-like aquaporin